MKSSFLPGVPVHERVQHAQVGGLLPPVAGHLVEQRALAVHHLVVRERQDEVLGVGVEHRERDLVVRPPAVDGVALHVLQDVVHPAHVPLVGEPETAEVHRPAHRGPRGRFLRRGDRPRRVLVRQRVQLPQELHRLEVLAPTVPVGHPLPRLARVVQVQHRRDGVDAQAVDVELPQPEERVAQQEVADLVAAVVEDERAPVLVLALPRVFVLVGGRAVEAREPVRSFGKWPGTQSSSTPMPCWWQASTKALNSSGGPKRLEGA
jgi:hypothetical protein